MNNKFTSKKIKIIKYTIIINKNVGSGSLKSPRPRRQRTTSINQSKTINASESIIRANNRTIYTAGRPPWYNCAGQQVEPFVIGVFYRFSIDLNKHEHKSQKYLYINKQKKNKFF